MGDIETSTDHLVAKGYTQLESVDYFDTYSPVAKMNTVCLLIAVAAAKNWFLEQLDVNNAFLHGDLNEEVYMTLPQGLYVEKPNQVCRLNKSLYGLEQANQQWYAKLPSFLHNLNIIQYSSYHSLFTKMYNISFIALLIYVDGIILAGDNLHDMNAVKILLDEKFKIKNLGPLNFFLGLEVTRTRKGIHVYQIKYALDIMADSGMLAARPSSTPMTKDMKLMFKQDKCTYEAEAYRRIIGRLLYLTNTRPDINFPVQFLSQFTQFPTVNHHNAINHIFRYIKNSPTQGIFFSCDFDIQLKAFSDSDWAFCVVTQRTSTCYCIYLGSSLISWKTKKQSIVSRSLSEAEYRALATTACEIQWLTFLLQDLQINIQRSVNLFCDNQVVRHIASNPVFHERTKHIEIDCHVVREKLQDGLFHLLPIKGSEQPADIFTKVLPQSIFSTMVSKLGLKNYQPLA